MSILDVAMKVMSEVAVMRMISAVLRKRNEP